tara:strand:- start:1518 stop:2126 length:609 start_codon:yes stop_codon:yes gene_type:complete
MFYNLKLSFIFFLTAFLIGSPEIPDPKFNNIDHSVKLNINSNVYLPVPFTVRDFVGFKNFLGFFESGSNYNKVNRFGYLGKYQFGKETLKMYGVRNLSEYRINPELQEKVFLMNVMRNKWILRREISWYTNRYLNGTYISESGIIAAAHLSGPGNVKKFLRSHCNPDLDKRDANGTSISDYLNIFKDYDLENIPAIQKPKRN